MPSRSLISIYVHPARVVADCYCRRYLVAMFPWHRRAVGDVRRRPPAGVCCRASGRRSPLFTLSTETRPKAPSPGPTERAPAVRAKAAATVPRSRATACKGSSVPHNEGIWSIEMSHWKWSPTGIKSSKAMHLCQWRAATSFLAGGLSQLFTFVKEQLVPGYVNICRPEISRKR